MTDLSLRHTEYRQALVCARLCREAIAKGDAKRAVRSLCAAIRTKAFVTALTHARMASCTLDRVLARLQVRVEAMVDRGRETSREPVQFDDPRIT